jgi:endonuclease YncB( thermonuclease family)
MAIFRDIVQSASLALALFPCGPAQAELVLSDMIYMIDGDTAKVGNQRYRLVGYDTPETWIPRCAFEKALGEAASDRARELVANAGMVDFVILPGRDKYNRGLASIYIRGIDLGEMLIGEGLARPYTGGRRGSWCE